MSEWKDHAIEPDWLAPPNVRACFTTRMGGVSEAPYGSLNLGAHVGDDLMAVMANRQRVCASLPSEPVWLEQVHGTNVIELPALPETAAPARADASVSFRPGSVCVVMTADCLPVLFARGDGSAVGAAHAGWRGLCNGVLEATVARMGGAEGLLAWLGPAIGSDAFEVGDEVRMAFMTHDERAQAAFRRGDKPGKWWADIYQLARQRLAAVGVEQVYGGGFCTVRDVDRFYSYRRDKVTGRMAALIWLE